MPNGLETRAKLERYLLARIPFVSVRSSERSRVQEILGELARGRNLDILLHTLSQGLRLLATGASVSDDKSLLGALELASQQFQARQNLTIVFTDVQHLSDDNETSRRFVDLATLAEEHGGSVIVITADPVWVPLQRLGMSIVLDVPDYEEMLAECRSFMEQYRQVLPVMEWGEREFEQAATILTGVTKTEALNILSTLVAKRSVTRQDLTELRSAKDSIFGDLAGIERVALRDSDYRLGGLAGLRRWLDDKRPLLTMDLRDRGLRPPRGVLLVGVPGCGKSLSAKAIATSWELPLYRLDLSAVFGQYVGQSERQLRDALATADSVAPCVLWIDEIEKGLAGSGSESTGVTARLVGQFLYWLQEATARVFVVATANDVRSLPQELLRRGRFDDMFFVDLPQADERREIIQIYWDKHLWTTRHPDAIDDLVVLSEGFAGSDIQAAVAEIACEEIRRNGPVDLGYMGSVFGNVVPLARSAPERIEEVRQFADRAIPASGKPVETGMTFRGQGRRVVLG
ncbi:AAA family ATPase [Actinomycetospora chiangmaiensis]|uniref:AAA family ATPase n=1 Tax=Actinomycetospora chiangmaiensis TaxID=402650 RepID=UPI0003621083|nr:AAA family ATPase [Actinomycetospora chiangmaiensis]